MVIPKEKYEFWYLMTTGELPKHNFSVTTIQNYVFIAEKFGSLGRENGVRRELRELEHRVVMEEWLCRKLRANEIVHHINGITTDNRLENLMLVNGMGEHMKFHRRGKRGGWKWTDGMRARARERMLGGKNPWSEEAKKRFFAGHSGPKNHNWKGGVSQDYKARLKKERTD
jgi:hypothetical protein